MPEQCTELELTHSFSLVLQLKQSVRVVDAGVDVSSNVHHHRLSLDDHDASGAIVAFHDHQEAHPADSHLSLIFAAGRQTPKEEAAEPNHHQSFHPAVIHHRVDHRVDHHVDHHADHLHDLAAGPHAFAYGLQAASYLLLLHFELHREEA